MKFQLQQTHQEEKYQSEQGKVMDINNKWRIYNNVLITLLTKESHGSSARKVKFSVLHV